MRTSDFDFYLPDTLIAQFPSKERSASRLLTLDGRTGNLNDELFRSLPDFFNPGDLLVFNDTRVIKARLYGTKVTGGKVEALIERILGDNLALAHLRASKSLRAGTEIVFSDKVVAKVTGREDDLFLIEFAGSRPILDILDEHGSLPLPPYITHAADKTDDERYQTVYSREPGAVAAPTAGLHFDESILERLKSAGIKLAFVTLHVGAGTFQPVRVENIADHVMHSERYTIPEETAKMVRETQRNGNRVVAVGTTALRALESAAQSGEIVEGSAETSIFITPGYQFKVVDRLITNFHLPKSTLLMLISAFAGLANVKHAYQHAIEKKYRFFSYGDAMLIDRK